MTTKGNGPPGSAQDAHMDKTRSQKLADYGERLRTLHNRVRPLLPEAQQDELLELAVGVALLALNDGPSDVCQCGHPQGRHRSDPILCLDCWNTGTGQDSTHHEHQFRSTQGAI
jgi:hypothetical protein